MEGRIEKTISILRVQHGDWVATAFDNAGKFSRAFRNLLLQVFVGGLQRILLPAVFQEEGQRIAQVSDKWRIFFIITLAGNFQDEIAIKSAHRLQWMSPHVPLFNKGTGIGSRVHPLIQLLCAMEAGALHIA